MTNISYHFISCELWHHALHLISTHELFWWNAIPVFHPFQHFQRAHARKEEGKLCGEVVKTWCKMIRHNGTVFIWCRKSIYHVETMNLQLYERYMCENATLPGNGVGWCKHGILRGKLWLGGCKMFVCMWVIIFNEWDNFLTVSSLSFVSSKSFSPHNFCVW